MSARQKFPPLEALTLTPEQLAILSLFDRLEAQADEIRDLKARMREIERRGK